MASASLDEAASAFVCMGLAAEVLLPSARATARAAGKAVKVARRLWCKERLEDIDKSSGAGGQAKFWAFVRSCSGKRRFRGPQPLSVVTDTEGRIVASPAQAAAKWQASFV